MRWRPKPLLMPVMSQIRCATVISPVVRGDLVDGGQPVERARVADERQQLGQHGQQRGAVVADVEVARDVARHLRVGAAERDEHREGQQFPGLQVDAASARRSRRSSWPTGTAGSAPRRPARRRTCPPTLSLADDPVLHGQADFRTGLRSRRRLRGQRQLDAPLGEDLVGGVQEVEHLGQPDVRDGLVDDLLHLDRASRRRSGRRRA